MKTKKKTPQDWFDLGRDAGRKEALQAIYEALDLEKLIEKAIEHHEAVHHDDD